MGLMKKTFTAKLSILAPHGHQISCQRQTMGGLREQLRPCLPQPNTCGAPGAAVSLWIKVQAPGQFPGIISSRRMDTARGFQLGYTTDVCLE